MVEQVKLKSLKCTICHDVFKAPTSLNCGHSFCKVCLEQYDEHSSEQHRIDGVMVCPNCRQLTKLEENRVAGLAPNFSLAGVGEELDITADVKSSDNCSLHNQIFNDIFCLVCKKFICETCLYDVAHQGHAHKKKEQLAAIVEKSRNVTIMKMEEKKRKIRKYTAKTKKRKHEGDSHLDTIEMEIEDIYCKKMGIIQGHKRRQLTQLDGIRNNSDKQMTEFIGRQQKSLQRLDEKCAIIEQEGIASRPTSTCKLPDSDALKTLYIELQNLKKEIDRDVKDVSMTDVLQEIEHTVFEPSGENYIDLGDINEGIAIYSEPDTSDQDASDS